MNILLIIYCPLFLLLAWKNFRWAIFLFTVLLPTYLIRFELLHIGKYPFPSTLLEISFGLLFLVWLVKYSREDYKSIILTMLSHKILLVAVAIFFISSVISIFVSDMVFYSLGEWRAYFLEPMIFFLILLGRKDVLKTTDLLWALIFSTVSISAYSVIQEFTGLGIATPEWTNAATRRVTAFFTSPNAVGLYLAPIFMLMISLVVKKITPPIIPSLQGEKQKEGFTKKILYQPALVLLLISTLLAALALAFTKSQGAWIGLGAGVLVFLLFLGYKKITIGLALGGIIFSLMIPSMREAIFFKDQANKNRLTLWSYSWTFLKQNPKNFILGTGVRQFFRKIQKPYYDKRVMERLIYPHNIFLNFWTEIGLTGALAISVVIGYAAFLANKIRRSDKIIGAGLLGALSVLVIHGLVDVPYFKNDLAFLFWILISSTIIVYAYFYKDQAVRV